MTPEETIAVVNATVALTGIALEAAPKVVALVQRIKEKDSDVTIPELEEMVARCHALDAEIQSA